MPTHLSRYRLFTLFMLALLLLGSGSVALARMGGSRTWQAETTPAQLPPLTEPVIARVYFDTPETLELLAAGLDVWEAYPDKGFLVARLAPEEYTALLQANYRVEIDAERTALVSPHAVLDPQFYYFDSNNPNPNGRYLVDFLQDTQAAYPDLTELIDAGDAWQGLHGGYARDIWVLRITNEDPAYGPIEDKPVFYLFGGIHAREVAIPELVIRYIKYLTAGYNGAGGYGLDADVTWLVNHHVIYAEVMQNPDGHVVNELDTSANRRKNLDNDDGCSSPSSLGVDLNRNHSFFWGCCGGSSGNPCDDTYRGPQRGAEPETQAFETFFASVVADQNGPNDDVTMPVTSPITASGILLSLHSYSDLILWPWEMEPAPIRAAELQTLGRKFASFNGYDPSGSIWYTVDGPTDDWVYGKFGVAAFTFEIGSSGGACGGFFPAYNCIEGLNGAVRNFWAENSPAFIYAHKIARTPYLTTYGPDTDSVLQIVAAPGDPAQLQAEIADHRYSSDPLTAITAAEYFIDAPGDDGSGFPMTPADGSWGGTAETVVASLDTASLPLGRHYVLVHGQNADGAWGPLTAAFVYIVAPGVSPQIEGYVRDAATNQPLAASISAGDFVSSSDPTSGFYQLTVISGTYDMLASAAGYVPAAADGIQAQDYQVVSQNFYLEPSCAALEDDVENGLNGWTAQSPWAISTEAAHSPTHAWSDSPGGNYSNNRNITLVSPLLDLTGYSNVSLSFWHTYVTEVGWDYGYVEYSTNGGTTWSLPVVTYDGQQTTWIQEIIMLPALDNQANARVRFRFYSDTSQTYDGWHIDDIQISGSGSACITPLAPSAEFSSNSPVTVGQPLRFTDQTLGSHPLQHAWDFGDGLGSATDSDPSYTYAAAGVYTVTLTVTNSLGSDSVSHVVAVLADVCAPLTSVSLDVLSASPTYVFDLTEFRADFTPDYAEKPYTYTLDFGDGGTLPWTNGSLDPLDFTHTYTEADVYTLTLSAWNCAVTQTVSAALPVTVLNHYGSQVTPPTASQWGDPGTPVTYTLWVTNTGTASDSFDVAISQAGWETQSPAILGPVAAGDSAPLAITVTLPITAEGGASDLALVSLVSQGDPAQVSTATLTTYAHFAGIAINPLVDAQNGDPGQVVTYTLRVTNTGDSANTFSIAVSGADWETTAPESTGSLEPGEGITLNASVAIPAAADGGASDAASLLFSSLNPAVDEVTVTLTTTANPLYGLALTADILEQAGAPGEALTYTLLLTHTGNTADAFSVVFSSTWEISVTTLAGPLVSGDLIALERGASAVLTVTLTVPVGAAPGDRAAAGLTFTSTGDAAQNQTLALTAVAAPAARLFLPLVLR